MGRKSRDFMIMEMIKMNKEKFNEILDKFLDNCYADGCRECHEIGHSIMAEQENIDELYKDLFGEGQILVPRCCNCGNSKDVRVLRDERYKSDEKC